MNNDNNFVFPDETIKIEYYGEMGKYVVTREETTSKPQRRVVDAGDVLSTLQDYLEDDDVWLLDVGTLGELLVSNDMTDELNSLRLEIAGLRARLTAIERNPYNLPPPQYNPFDYTYGTDVVYKYGDSK